MNIKKTVASLVSIFALTSALSAHEIGIIHAHNDISVIAISATAILFTGAAFYISKFFSK